MALQTFHINKENVGRRLDAFLAGQLADQFSRTQIKSFIVSGKVTVNGEVQKKPKFMLYENQTVVTNFEPVAIDQVRAEDIPIEVVFEDEDILVVNKPAGMVVHPACGHLSGTLVNALLHHVKTLSKVGGEIRAGIIHRLDKNTSGLLVVAKNDEAHGFLAREFKHHRVRKIYWAVVKGVVQHDEMHSEEPLGRSDGDRRKVVVKPEGGRESRTHFKVLKRFKTATLVEARPETGRTHQIRVHLKHLHYPVLGDQDYGVASPLIHRQALHSKTVSFVHPRSQKKLSFDSDLPKDMKELLKSLA